MVTKGKMYWGGVNLESGIGKDKLLHNSVLLYSTGNYVQYLVINYYGKEQEKE